SSLAGLFRLALWPVASGFGGARIRLARSLRGGWWRRDRRAKRLDAQHVTGAGVHLGFAQVGAAVEAGSPSLAAIAPASAAIAARLAAKAGPVKRCAVPHVPLLDCQPTP